MEILLATEVLARIDAARATNPDGSRGVIAFDGDGTLWSGDVGDDFLHALIARGDFRTVACDEMRAAAAEFGLGTDGGGAVLAKRLFEAYEGGHFPEERTYELVAWACAGWDRSEVERFAAEIIEGASLRARLHREVVRAVEWARGVGVEVFVVSASPRAVVEQAARTIGILPSHVIAATATFDGQTMCAAAERPIPYAGGKVTCLRARIGERPLHAAFGDNAFDVAMLNQASVPVAVRPKARLRERAHEVPAMVEIAPEL